ncbi:hypothetical protein HGA34_05570 [Candidatus Falkowbacteria bacterium]|nr:hypothetical protein [Candidatus Falkowbacteria bacterium]
MQKLKKLLTICTVISLVVANGRVIVVNASPLTSVSDTLTDSAVGAAADHTVTLTTKTALAAGDYFSVILPVGFGGILLPNVSCPANTDADSPASSTALCVANAPIATGTFSIIISDVANPGTAGSQIIEVSTRDSGDAIIESSQAMVAIIDSIVAQADVPATLTFEIRPLSTSTTVNGATTTLATATTSIAYGDLSINTPEIAAQELRVITNATEGFSVTIQQDQNLMSGGSADIDSFINGTSSAPQAWTAPSSILDAEWTYGHFGFTTDDASLFGGDLFGDSLWKGLASTTPAEVMYHDGPADGLAEGKGVAKIGYQIEVGGLQQTGDYSNNLTYVVTPIY